MREGRKEKYNSEKICNEIYKIWKWKMGNEHISWVWISFILKLGFIYSHSLSVFLTLPSNKIYVAN